MFLLNIFTLLYINIYFPLRLYYVRMKIKINKYYEKYTYIMLYILVLFLLFIYFLLAQLLLYYIT